MNDLKKIIKSIVIILLVIGFIFLGILFYIGNYVYDYTLNPHASKNIADHLQISETLLKQSQQWLNEHTQDLYMTQDDLRLHAYYLEQYSDTYIIMVHGYRGRGASIISPIKQMTQRGYNVLIPDLRGHGKSEGDYIGMGCVDCDDILSWINLIIQKDQEAQIILYGVYMGGATVMNVAGQHIPSQVKAVIEDCGYTSVWETLKTHTDMSEIESDLALSMARLITWLKAGYDLNAMQPLKQVKTSQIPILFIHGDDDDFVPVSMVYSLYQEAQCEKQLLIVHGAGHANSCSLQPKIYYQTIFDFIEKYAKKNDNY